MRNKSATLILCLLVLAPIAAGQQIVRSNWISQQPPSACGCDSAWLSLSLENKLNEPVDARLELRTQDDLSGFLPRRIALKPFEETVVPLSFLIDCNAGEGNKLFSIGLDYASKSGAASSEEILASVYAAACTGISLESVGANAVCPDKSIEYAFELENTGRKPERGSIQVNGVNPAYYTLSDPFFSLAGDEKKTVTVLYTPPARYGGFEGDSLSIQATGENAQASASVPLKTLACPTPTPKPTVIQPPSPPTPAIPSPQPTAQALNLTGFLSSNAFPAATGLFTAVRSSLTASAIIILVAITAFLYYHSTKEKREEEKLESRGRDSRSKALRIAKAVRGR